MAKLERTLYQEHDFEDLLERIADGVLNGSASATLEDRSDFVAPNARCSVLVFERYSYLGGNRVSMAVTLFQAADRPIKLSAITSGGSQAVFFKVNTFGEESFLEALADLLPDL